ncbi:S8 family peptidase [Effusibacillus pohliae]|uniref:S8 family peptidase n=1 Tax=Effusibacillus pohliae TaxID=232270 RepID=UPI00037C0A81|nr:S8 family peptidase [Effusibacillus pohliae]
MRRYLWAGATLAVLLAFTTVLGPRPFHLPLQNPPRIANYPGAPADRPVDRARNLRAHHTSPQGRAEIAAQDMAVTTALCVRDCRIALQQLANQLDHTTDPAMRSQLMKNAIQEHPQFRALVLHTSDGRAITQGTPTKPQFMRESVDGVRKTGEFYVTDLYDGPGQASQLLMAIALPLVQGLQSAGILAAEAEMGYLRSVADRVDGQMGTQTHLQTKDGDQVLLHPEQPHVQGGDAASQNVDGTKWHASSVTVRPPAENVKPRIKANEVLVQFHHEPDAATLSRIQTDINGTVVKRNHLPSFVFRSNSMTTEQLVDYFKKIGVRMVEPHRVMRHNSLPNDILYPRYQWNFPLIQIENAWNTTTGNPSTIIAVVDTGIDLAHPEFAGQLVTGHNMLNDSDNPQDDNGHGTHVAGVIAAKTNNIEGVAGMNWNSKVMPIKALGADGSGSVLDIADGIRWAVDHGAKVINLSLGEYEDSRYLHEAIQYAASKDVLVVAAMGNDDTDQPSYPAAYPEVLAVTAVDENRQRATFSNYGSNAGVAAPGVSIASTFPGHRYAAMSGTSMASPHVAGLAGLIRSVNPGLSADQVKDIILRSSTDLGPAGPDPYYGRGLINVNEAIRQAQAKAQDTAPSAQPPSPFRKTPWWWPLRRLFSF